MHEHAVADLRGASGVEYRFDSAGFLFSAPGRTSRMAWDTLHGSLETPAAFAIYTSPAMVMVVPKRAFGANDRILAGMDIRVATLEDGPAEGGSGGMGGMEGGGEKTMANVIASAEDFNTRYGSLVGWLRELDARADIREAHLAL